MKKRICLAAALTCALALLFAQDIKIYLPQGERPALAIPDFRGDAQAQPFMNAFNTTLWGDVDGAGLLRLVPKTNYPKDIPQQPADWRQPPPARAPSARQNPSQMTALPSGGGRWQSDWSGPPVSANFMVFGYTAVQNGVLTLYGWLWDLGRGSQVFAQRYFSATVDDAGARDIAHKFAADIITQFGGQPISGTHIYFSRFYRTGVKEIWSMDPDGQNQKQITRFNSISTFVAASPDGSKIVFSSYTRGNPGIFVFSVDPVRDLRFYNQRASVNSSPSFTPDGKQIVYSSSAPNDRCCRLYVANLDGSDFRRITSGSWIDTEPKVNPKNGDEIVFVSGRSSGGGVGQQLYTTNMEGADVQRLTPGEGEASNPSWHPGGQIIAFAWTRGFMAGDFNIFTMDVAKRTYKQLTHSEGKNENPSWAPDGVHIVFSSTRTGSPQIWTMLADGTQLRQLTTQGNNERPVWSK